MTFNNKFNLGINSIVVVIFMLLNPLYGLFLTTLASLFTKRISYLLVGILSVISFSLMFANQNFSYEISDLFAYIDLYRSININEMTIISIFKVFAIHFNHKEPLWFLYSMLIGELTNYSDSIFILTTYAVIFSLCSITAYLISEKSRYNPILILFSLFFIELVLLISGYDQWRIVIATLLFIIGLVVYNPDSNKFISRVYIYSSWLIHIAFIPYVLAFEIYSVLIYRKTLVPKNGRYYLRILFILFSAIFTVGILEPILRDIIIDWPTSAMDDISSIYLSLDSTHVPGGNDKHDFNIRDYLNLLYLLVIFYIFYNWKYLQSYEVFLIMAFILLEVVQIYFNQFGILYTRALLFPSILFVFISTKGLVKFRGAYIFYFVCLIFFVRIFQIYSNNLYYQLEKIAKGDFINPNYGLITSIISYDPKFI